MIRIPSVNELYTGIKANLETEFGAIPAFGKNFLRALAMVQAAKLKLYYLAIGKIQKNIFIDTAETESSGGTLERFGRIKLGRNPFPAVAGQYNINVTGAVGSVIPGSTTFKSNDDSLSPGKLYILDLPYVLVSSPDVINVRALESGTDSKLLLGDQLTATAPIAGVDRVAVVDAETLEPKEAESIEEFRRKALDAFRLEPNGGSASDYRLWAADAEGVKTVYPYAKTNAPCEINLYVEANAVDSTDGKGTPSLAILNDVESVIELDPDTGKPLNERSRRPLQVIVNYLPVAVKEIDIDIAAFVGINPAIEAQILTAITEMVNSIRPFVAGADAVESKNDILDTNKIISTILTVRPGSVFGAITLKVATVATPSYTFINGNIPHLNTVTYS
jgi:hypothetical protein